MNFSTRVAYLAGAAAIILGTTAISGGTAGSILFVGSGGVMQQDNSNLFWNDTNNYLGVGNSNPTARLHVNPTTGGQFLVSTDGIAYHFYQSETHPRIQFGRDLGFDVGSSSSGHFATTYDGGTSIAAGGAAFSMPASRELALYTSNGTALSQRLFIGSTGFVGINTDDNSTGKATSLLEVFQTPTDATGAAGDSQRIRITGETTSNLARGIDWYYGGAMKHSINSNASTGKGLLYAASTYFWEIAGGVGAGTTPAVTLSNGSSFTGSSGTQVGVKISHTINQTGTAGFSGIDLDVTGTAGSGTLNLLNLKRSGSSVFSVSSTGQTTVPDGSSSAPGLVFAGASNIGVYRASTNVIGLVASTPLTWDGANSNLTLGQWGGSGSDKTISPGSAGVGNNNRLGDDLVITGGESTGDQAGGDIMFKTGSAGSSGSSVNALTTRMTIDDTGKIVIAGDTFIISTAKTPASAAATCTTGQHAWDTSYVYVCVATDTWKRAAIATW